MSALMVPKGRICPHTHCRDEEQKDKATVSRTLNLAKRQGVGMIFDMPNPARPVTSHLRVHERLALVPKGQESHYRLYVGLTARKEQIFEACWCDNHIPAVVGLKLFAGTSVGPLAVVELEAQRQVYQTLADIHYTGVVAVHCEKEELLRSDLWKPNNPISHTWARPPEAEVESVRDQIRLAKETGFRGHLHICHVSVPESVELVNQARQAGMRISCGVTPHHLLWDENRYSESEGLDYKMNPPLRSSAAVFVLRHQLQDGQIDWIETDHAPHTAKEKRPPLCLSGYPSLRIYRECISELLMNRLGMTEPQICALTRGNIIAIFGDKLGIVA